MLKEATKSNWADKLAKPVFLIAMCCLFLGTVFYLVSGYRSAFPNGILPPKKEENFLPPKELTYHRLKNNEKNVDGLYRNLYEITILHPAGNTDPNNIIVAPLSFQGAECTGGSERRDVEVGPGLATTTRKILFDCLSKEPILDNGNLFDVINPK